MQSPLHNHHLGNTWHGENGVALGNPLCSSLGRECKASCGFCLQPWHGSGVLFFTVVLSWGQPKTLPGWHVLVGEERTEGVSKQTRRLQ